MERFTKGTIEYMIISVVDRLQGITTLVGTNPTYDLRIRDATGYVLTAQPCNVNGMDAEALLDTTNLAVGTYELFLNFVIAPEHPRLGPFPFEVY